MGEGAGAEWYADGLRFECTKCGACCSGGPGVVSFSRAEAARIAMHLGVTTEQFLERYTHETGGDGLGRSLNEIETEHGLDCVFLDRCAVPDKAVCSLYEARPGQCRTFPWWPEHLRSPRSWQRLSRQCEGIGRGAIVPIDRIRIDRERARTAKKGAGSTALTS